MQRAGSRTVALGLASTGLATSAIAMWQVWSDLELTRNQTLASIWPLPGLYLVEVVALSAIVMAAVIGRRRRGAFVAWAAIGALSAMALLGAMTIGPNIALSLIFLVPASILGDEAQSHKMSRLAGFVVGVVVQAGLMLSVIQYLLHRPMAGQGV